jgi:N-acetyl sugar amidotransferase
MQEKNSNRSTSSVRVCTRGLWDETMPGIKFDANGVSNYAHLMEDLTKPYPRGPEGKRRWDLIVESIKRSGTKNKRYNCIVGVSGGTDSSYLLYMAVKQGLKPLAVNLDNGWSSEIAVNNIKKITNALDIDLETYVINYEEVKAVQRAYIKAALPWIDAPTDLAIKAVLYRIAAREGVKFVFNGSDFRTEGKQPTDWTYSDNKQLKYLVRKFSGINLKTFPTMSMIGLIYHGYIRRIKVYRPYYYLDYQKKSAQEFLIREFGWQYYGGHHHENIFTRFAIAYWMPQKFSIDKRKITLSAQVFTGEITREEALKILSLSPYDPKDMERDKDYMLKKLDFTQEEFQKIWALPNKHFTDYPNNYNIIKRFSSLISRFLPLVFTYKPAMLSELEMK